MASFNGRNVQYTPIIIANIAPMRKNFLNSSRSNTPKLK
jgi:hypothetical protein